MSAATRRDNAPRERGEVGRCNSTSSPQSSPIDRILPMLERVKRTGPNTWLASCPTRDDKHPSMTIRELDDGRCLIHDFGGDSIEDILGALGLTFSDLYPPRAISHHVKSERRPFPCADSFRAVAFEATIVALAGAAIVAGEPINQFDRDRLIVAVGRINDALTAAGVNHG